MVIPDWPVFATLTSITIIATNNTTNVTVKAVSDAAAYLAASTAAAPNYLYGTWTGSDASPSTTYNCGD
ncbi:hypothetical protein, partial [Klebsiella pneumoniae]|uniref:hypothetical protein n=1 Tax=Klebsiella pneumoniae TaxID=573 RepID=UPI003852B9AB